MTALASAQPGLFSRLPLVGFVARDIGRDINIVFYLLTILVTALVLAIKTWGLVALAMTALAMVPVMFVVLIAITRG